MYGTSRPCGKLLVILLFLAYPTPAPAVTPAIPDQPPHHVVDLAGVIEANPRERLNFMLADLEANRGVPVVVLTLASLDGEALETFSRETALIWGKGPKLKGNGVLLTVAVKERQYRLEVGSALEAILTGAMLDRICTQYLAPSLKRGDFSAGIFSTVTEITNHITLAKAAAARSSTPDPYSAGYRAGRPGLYPASYRRPEDTGIASWLWLVFPVVGIIFFVGAYLMGFPVRIGWFSFRRRD